MNDAAGVKSGEWYSSSKFRPKHLMEVSLTSEEQKVHACLELGSMAYQREGAVYTVKGGKTVPMTPRYIQEHTQLSKQHVRRAIQGLEAKGLAQRCQIDPARGLTKGNVEIKSWLKPRPPSIENGSRAMATILDSLGPEFKPLLAFANRFKIKCDERLLGVSRDSLEQALVAIAKAEEAEKEAVAILKGVLANGSHNKDERKGKELESNTPPPQPFVNGSNGHQEEEERVLQSTEKQTQTPRPPDLYDEFKAAYPQERFDEAKVKPLFRALPRPVQQRAITRLRERYLTCERWQDEAGKWIPFASKWLNEKQYDADPPPKWSKHENGGRKELAPVDEVLALMRRNREAMP